MKIKIKLLNTGFFFRSRCQSDSGILEPLPVMLGDQSLRRHNPRHQIIIRSQENQSLDILQTRSLNITRHYFVQTWRNHSHSRLLEPGIQKFWIFLEWNIFISKKSNKLIKELHDSPVNLRIFLCQCQLPRLRKLVLLNLYLLLHFLLYQKFIECGRHILHRFFTLLQHKHQSVHLFHQTHPQMIQCLQVFFCRLRTASDPFFLPFLIPTDSKCKDIVFHQIHFTWCKSCKSGSQKPKYTLVGKILFCNSKKTPHIFHERIQKYISLIIQEYRNMISCKVLFDFVSINIHITGNHGNISIPIALLPHKKANPLSRTHNFICRIMRQIQADTIRFFLILLLSMPKHFWFQMCKRRITAETINRPAIKTDRLFHQNLFFLCQFYEWFHHLLT